MNGSKTDPRGKKREADLPVIRISTSDDDDPSGFISSGLALTVCLGYLGYITATKGIQWLLELTVLLWILLVVIGFSIWVLLVNLRRYPPARRLAVHGKLTRGVVQKAWKENNLDMTRRGYIRQYASFFVHFQYHINGKTYILKQRVSSQVYSCLKEGDQVTVRYLPEKPSCARLVSQER